MFGDPKKEYISKEKLEPIALTHDIEDMQSFYKIINTIASIYFHYKPSHEGHPTNKSTRKSLEKVKAQATKLAETIDNLNDYESRWLWRAQHDVRARFDGSDVPRLKYLETAKVDVMGNTIHLLGLGKDGTYIHKTEIEDIRQSLSVIQNYAQHGLDTMHKGRDGRRRRHGLYMLIRNLQTFWAEDLGQQFTFDEYKGEGITDAYAFCRDITLALDPDVTPTQVKSQMRHVIAKN